MKNSHDNLLILGGSGLLGSKLLAGGYIRKYHCISQGRGSNNDIQADLRDIEQARQMLKQTEPSAIINLIGLTNVDLCEKAPNEAYMINVKTIQNVLEASRSLSLRPRFIHISTDQVYDGVGPHYEKDVTLTNYYAFSKYAAELLVEAEGGLILRTNFFGKSTTAKRKSFTDWLYEELDAGREINVFEDVFFSPLSIDFLCGFIEKALVCESKGVFNVGSREGLSKADFAFYFAKMIGLPINKIKRVRVSEVDYLKAYRPKDMRMKVEKIEKEMDIILPNLSSEISRVAKEYKT
jgi:dTDP-4-dehydrorhamnose reductase